MKVVGYYNSFSRQDEIFKIDLLSITHINYAFLIPKEDGSVFFHDEDNVKRVVNLAHEKNKKIFVSVGGYCDHDKIISKVFEQICKDYDVFKKFIANVIDVVKKFNFDGIDLDWEYPWIEYRAMFELMVIKLRIELDFLKKGFSLAIHRAIAGQEKYNRIASITKVVLDNVDWLNIMTYDDQSEENHSSMQLVQDCVKYWCIDRNVPKEKVLIGIPFYARPSETVFDDLVEKDKMNYFTDNYNDDTYNGFKLVRKKLEFAKKECGGIIIWAINYDRTDGFGLLKVIDDSISY